MTERIETLRLFEGDMLLVLESGTTHRIRPSDEPIEGAVLTPESKDVVTWTAYDARQGRYQNLLLVDSSGAIRWKAQLPPGEEADAYVRGWVDRRSGRITATSWSGWYVTLDGADGTIIRQRFGK